MRKIKNKYLHVSISVCDKYKTVIFSWPQVIHVKSWQLKYDLVKSLFYIYDVLSIRW